MRKLKIVNKRSGVCLIISEACYDETISDWEYDKLMDEMHRFLTVKGWHSGDVWYPIKHPRLDSLEAFCECRLWTRLTTYGRRRRATLAHLNNYLKELRNA